MFRYNFGLRRLIAKVMNFLNLAKDGSVAERLKALVLKTSEDESPS